MSAEHRRYADALDAIDRAARDLDGLITPAEEATLNRLTLRLGARLDRKAAR